MVQVNEINITVPGMNEGEAGEFGRLVAERMAAGLTGNTCTRSAMINEMNVQYRQEAGMGQAEMADRIAAKLLLQLNML